MTERLSNRARTLVLLLGAVILLALVVGYLQHPAGAPMDDGTPANVTTTRNAPEPGSDLRVSQDTR